MKTLVSDTGWCDGRLGTTAPRLATLGSVQWTNPNTWHKKVGVEHYGHDSIPNFGEETLMLFVCAPDSFKESMTASEAANAMERGILQVFPHAEIVAVPMADGGEGTGDALAARLGGESVEVSCHDALGRPTSVEFHFVPEQSLAVIEVARACGLEGLAQHERDARRTSSRGVGELIKGALDHGATTLLICLGGSATNDAGSGMLTALGARLLDAKGQQLPDGGAALAQLDSIDVSGLDSRLRSVKVRVATDVDNPLTGPNGASAVFGPQKGADTLAVQELDAALRRWSEITHATIGRDVDHIPGAGAAGGLGAAFLAYFQASLDSGAELVMDASQIDKCLRSATVVFTGEGSLDTQSAGGKVPVKVAARAKAAGVPTVVFAGRITPELARHLPDGIHAAVPIVRSVSDLTEALAAGPSNLEHATEMVCQLMRLGMAAMPTKKEPF